MHPITEENQVGALLASRRKALKLSQTDVATRIALSQNRLSELERDPGTLTVAQLLALLNVLELDLQIGERRAAKK
jgi:HTH-type transcriptional regulator/antitoxin HipB